MATAKEKFHLASVCRAHTDDAIKTLVKIVNDPDSKDSDKISASIAILDRGYGKPVSSVEMLGKDGEAVTPQVCFYVPDNGRKLEDDTNE